MAPLRRSRKGALERPDPREAEAALAEAVEGHLEAQAYLSRADSIAREAQEIRHRNHFAARIYKAYQGKPA